MNLTDFQTYLVQSKSPTTADRYYRDVQKFLRWHDGNKQSADDTCFSEKVSTAYIAYIRSNYSRSTSDRTKAAINTFCQWAFDAGHTEANIIISDADVPPLQNKQLETLLDGILGLTTPPQGIFLDHPKWV